MAKAKRKNHFIKKERVENSRRKEKKEANGKFKDFKNMGSKGCEVFL